MGCSGACSMLATCNLPGAELTTEFTRTGRSERYRVERHACARGAPGRGPPPTGAGMHPRELHPGLWPQPPGPLASAHPHCPRVAPERAWRAWPACRRGPEPTAAQLAPGPAAGRQRRASAPKWRLLRPPSASWSNRPATVRAPGRSGASCGRRDEAGECVRHSGPERQNSRPAAAPSAAPNNAAGSGCSRPPCGAPSSALSPRPASSPS